MKQRYFAVLATLSLLAALVLPQQTLAARTIWLQRQQQESTFVSTISPADPQALELLDILHIELQATDPLWSDADFIAFVMKYKEIRQNGIDLISDLGDLVLQAFDLDDLGAKVDDERIQQAFALTEEERAAQEELKTYIKENLEAFKADPNAFLEEFVGSMDGLDDYEFINDEIPYAYGYADPYGPVEAGRVVWLYNDSYNPLGTDMTATWTQTYGPEVTWLNTDSGGNAAFIMPDLQDSGYDYLLFELMVDNGVSTSTYEVYVEAYVPLQSEVADAFREIMGREIDDFHHAYWEELWYQGMPIEQIRHHFELLKEHEAEWQHS